jgi:hypothetical protein
MVGLLKALRMGIEYRFNIKQMPNMENNSERTLAKYYSQTEESNHKLKFTKRLDYTKNLNIGITHRATEGGFMKIVLKVVDKEVEAIE